MSRSLSSTTLKLPARKVTSTATDDTRSFPRKPVRGGFIAPKQSVTQRAKSIDDKAVPPAMEARKKYGSDNNQRNTPLFNKDAPQPPVREIEAAKANAAFRNTQSETPPPKTYPKRGIARSTGARALPPARTENEYLSRQTKSEQNSTALLLPTLPPRQVTAPPLQTAVTNTVRRTLNEPPRLSKRISKMCQCSRREADEWIENGWVRVDGAVVTTLGTRVHPKAQIEIKEEASKHQTESVTILLNKPLETISEHEDGVGESLLLLIRPENRWAEDETRLNFKASHLRGLAQVGKLDTESTGMLVFTQEGSVARRIAGDDTRLEKEYMVRVEGELTPTGMKLLNQGLKLDDIQLKRAQVSWQNEQQLRFVLHESRKRQIQRMCELVGLRVTSIKRIRIGSVSLGKLPIGKWRYLRENERF